jgi:hypothetical protein
VSKGLAGVDFDGAKTCEELDEICQYPGGNSGKLCGAEVLERSNFLRSKFDAFAIAHKATAGAARACARRRRHKTILCQRWNVPNMLTRRLRRQRPGLSHRYRGANRNCMTR